jgi:hypothetical protein
MGRPTAEQLIEALGLRAHPEGGYFREIHRSEEAVPAGALPERYSGSRAYATSILFLITAESFSALHRLDSDEIYHFYLGGPVDLSILHADGRAETVRLGHDVLRGERVQHVVPRGAWQGSRLAGDAPLALLGCTVAPGFDFDDFEMADRNALIARHPDHAALIRSLTHAGS